MTKATKKKTTKAVAKVEGAVSTELMQKYGDLGEDDDIRATDLISPKLLLAQSQSKIFMEKKADLGDYFDSLEQAVAVPQGKSEEFIVIKNWRAWTVFENTGKGQPKYVATEDFTVRPDRPREETVKGALIENFETHNYFIIFTKDLKEDSEGCLPYTLSFRSTGLMASKTIKSVALKAKMKGTNVPLCFNVFTLGTEYRENEDGKWYVPVIKKARNATDAELVYVKQFMDLVKSSDIQVDNSDLEAQDDGVVDVNEVPPPVDAEAPAVEV